MGLYTATSWDSFLLPVATRTSVVSEFCFHYVEQAKLDRVRRRTYDRNNADSAPCVRLEPLVAIHNKSSDETVLSTGGRTGSKLDT